MNAVEMEIREEVAKRLGLLEEGEVTLFTRINAMDLQTARTSGALKYITCFDGRRFYEVAEVLRWLKSRGV